MGYRPNSNPWLAFLKHAGPLVGHGTEVFEIGPGSPRRSLVRRYCEEVGANYSWADIRNQPRRYPGFCRMRSPSSVRSAGDRFDVAVAFQMLHNCARPWLLFPELTRLLKPGGHLVVVSTMYEKQNRHPVDCGRIWPDGLRVLLDDAGLEVEKMVVETGLDGGLGRPNTVGNVEAADLIAIGLKG